LKKVAQLLVDLEIYRFIHMEQQTQGKTVTTNENKTASATTKKRIDDGIKLILCEKYDNVMKFFILFHVYS
jgi:hypothetical protein